MSIHNRKVVFITSCSAKIGFGHIARCKILANEFRKNKVESIFLVNDECPFTNRIEHDYHVVKTFGYDHCFKILEELNDSYSVTVIIDTVELEYNMLSWIRSELPGVFLVTITLFMFDLEHRFEHLSFFPDMADASIRIHESTFGPYVLCSGSSYIMFREEYHNLKKIIRSEANRMLVTMGGSDPKGLTLRFLTALKLKRDDSITVILSKVCPTFNEVKRLINDSEHNCFILHEHVDNLAELMINNDIVILNGGLTRYEACMCKTPFLALSIHQKQFDITAKLTKHGVGINLGVIDEVSDEVIELRCRELLRDYEGRMQMSKNMQALFDDEGAQRIYKQIESSLMSFNYEKD